jgi:caffeoyl-CoA O-methyltransferase
MIDVLHSVYQYCDDHSKGLEPVLTELERTTHLETTNPRMLSGFLQGMFLQTISVLKNPMNILEIGTFTGYSAICLAKGLEENGKLITIDTNEETLAIAKKYITKAGLESKIDLIHGDAKKVISDLHYTFDIAFIDADKENYFHYYNLVKPKMNRGGLIILDNMLWSGKVLEDNKDAKTKALHDLNKYIKEDEEVQNLLLPLRDGLQIVTVL